MFHLHRKSASLSDLQSIVATPSAGAFVVALGGATKPYIQRYEDAIEGGFTDLARQLVMRAGHQLLQRVPNELPAARMLPWLRSPDAVPLMRSASRVVERGDAVPVMGFAHEAGIVTNSHSELQIKDKLTIALLSESINHLIYSGLRESQDLSFYPTDHGTTTMLKFIALCQTARAYAYLSHAEVLSVGDAFLNREHVAARDFSAIDLEKNNGKALLFYLSLMHHEKPGTQIAKLFAEEHNRPDLVSALAVFGLFQVALLVLGTQRMDPRVLPAAVWIGQRITLAKAMESLRDALIAEVEKSHSAENILQRLLVPVRSLVRAADVFTSRKTDPELILSEGDILSWCQSWLKPVAS